MEPDVDVVAARLENEVAYPDGSRTSFELREVLDGPRSPRRPKMTRAGRWVAVLVAGTVSACGTTATIERKIDGPMEALEAKIVRGNAMNIFVEDGDDVRPISRDEIRSIDHPGNAVGTFGGVLGVYGVFNIVAGTPLCDEKGDAFCAGVFLPVALGAAMMGWGFYVWNRSRSAAGQTISSP